MDQPLSIPEVTQQLNALESKLHRLCRAYLDGCDSVYYIGFREISPPDPSDLTERIDDLERHQEKVNFEHKMAFFAMRERYAKAMLHLHHKLELIDTKTFYDVNGDIVTDKNAKCVKHIPKDWMIIWQWVYHKVHKHLKQIRLQYHYGRNPAKITTSHPLKVIVNKD